MKEIAEGFHEDARLAREESRLTRLETGNVATEIGIGVLISFVVGFGVIVYSGQAEANRIERRFIQMEERITQMEIIAKLQRSEDSFTNNVKYTLTTGVSLASLGLSLWQLWRQ